MQYIAKFEIASSTASVTFSSIPQTFKHLYIMCGGRSSRASTSSELRLRANGSSSAIYDYRRIESDGSSSNTSGGTGGTQIQLGYSPGSSSLASVFGSSSIWILDYTNTTYYKNALSLTNDPNNAATPYLNLVSSTIQTTSAISSITLLDEDSAFQQYSFFYLYGLT